MAARSSMFRLVTRSRQIRVHAPIRQFASRPETPLLNEALANYRAVRLISEAGEDYGIMAGEEALRRARKGNRDVMQVSGSKGPNAPPPVVRLLNYSVYEETRQKRQYEKRKTDKENKRLQKKETALKQLRLSPSTHQHDMDIKMRQAKEFLKQGYRVKVYIQFRRGQGRLSDDAKAALVSAAKELSEFGIVQGVPPNGNFEDLFATKEKDEQELETPPKKRPLQIIIRPFARKVRQQMVDELSAAQEA